MGARFLNGGKPVRTVNGLPRTGCVVKNVSVEDRRCLMVVLNRARFFK